MLDRSTNIGLTLGFSLIIMAIVLQGSLSIFASGSSFLIVTGGVIAATMVNYSFEDIKLCDDTQDDGGPGGRASHRN